MPRFYCPDLPQKGEILILPTNVSRHIKVLRLQPGEKIILFNNDHAGEFIATIKKISRDSVQVQLDHFFASQRETKLNLHLALSMPANERMDWLVEKAVETGVASIQPLISERSVLRLSHDRAAKKVKHWHGIAISACEQCGGNRVPVIYPVQDFNSWLKNTSDHKRPDTTLNLFLSFRADAKNLSTTIAANPESSSITVLSGPEGGFSQAEEHKALQANFMPITLGPRTLRAETAALAASILLLL